MSGEQKVVVALVFLWVAWLLWSGRKGGPRDRALQARIDVLLDDGYRGPDPIRGGRRLHWDDEENES